MRGIVGTTAVAAASALLLPITALGQATKAGVVTTLQGSATVARSTAPQPAPLRFKDEVFVEDRIVTGESSTVRILLGGKAVITVRERSTLTISETATTSTVSVDAGKIALAVAKDRMKPGESVEIKTPNAVAGVRGTVVIAEVTGEGAAVNSRFTLLTGIVDVTLLDWETGRPSGLPVTLRPLQGIGVTHQLGPVRAVSRGEALAIASSYKVSVPTPPRTANTQVMERQIDQAVQHSATLTDTKESSVSGSTAPAGTSTRTRDDDSRGGRRGNDDSGRGSTGGGRTAAGGGSSLGGGSLGGGPIGGTLGGPATGGNVVSGQIGGPVVGGGLLGGNNRATGGGGIPGLGGDDLRQKLKDGLTKKHRD